MRIGLTRETNTRLNKDYSVVNFTKLYDFEGEELAQIRSFAGGFITQIKQMNQQRAAMLAAGAAIPEDADGAPTVLPENADTLWTRVCWMENGRNCLRNTPEQIPQKELGPPEHRGGPHL